MTASHKASPSPFLKWAGGKRQLLPALTPYFPDRIESYVEPFVGSGAVFFHLRGRGSLAGRIVLADINEELINAYCTVQQDVEGLIARLQEHRAQHGREHYYEVRARPFTRDTAGAARTLYLNKTGFNGLFRVNSKGQFNVPMGRYANPGICDAEGLRTASAALQGVCLAVREFADTLEDCGEGDFVYLDPPYVPLSPTAHFTAYVAGGFGPAHQEALACCVREAHARGARFVLSNSWTPEVERLYGGFDIRRVPARRAINSRCEGRGPVDEAVVLPREWTERAMA